MRKTLVFTVVESSPRATALRKGKKGERRVSPRPSRTSEYAKRCMDRFPHFLAKERVRLVECVPKTTITKDTHACYANDES